MNRQRMTLTVGLAASLALALLLLTGQNLQAQGGAKGTVAVCNLEQVVKGLAIQQQFQAQLNKRRVEVKAEQEERQKKIQQLQNQLKILNPGGPEFEKAQDELIRATVDLEAWLKFEQARLQRDTSLHIARIYKDALETAGKVAANNGYTVLMVSSTDLDFAKLAPKDLQSAIQARKVLWSDPAVDLTQQVVTQMNNDYTARGGGGG